MQRECGVTSVDEVCSLVPSLYLVRTPIVASAFGTQSEVPERWRAAELSRVHKDDNEVVNIPTFPL